MKTTVQNWFIKYWKQKVYYLSLLMLLCSSFSTVAGVCFQIRDIPSTSDERNLNSAQYSAAPATFHRDADSLPRLADNRVDFQVQTVSRHRLRISFNNNSGNSIFVKIYDVIGNLIRHEKIDKKGKFKKDYDLSNAPTDFYVIEVGDKEFSTVKRLFPN
jgi:hypothetical protein